MSARSGGYSLGRISPCTRVSLLWYAGDEGDSGVANPSDPVSSRDETSSAHVSMGAWG